MYKVLKTHNISPIEFLIYCRDNMKVSRPVFNQKRVMIQQLIKEATEF